MPIDLQVKQTVIMELQAVGVLGRLHAARCINYLKAAALQPVWADPASTSKALPVVIEAAQSNCVHPPAFAVEITFLLPRFESAQIGPTQFARTAACKLDIPLPPSHRVPLDPSASTP